MAGSNVFMVTFQVLKRLLKDEVISRARITPEVCFLSMIHIVNHTMTLNSL